MPKFKLNRSFSNNRFGGIFLRAFCLMVVVIAAVPFLDNWYENKVGQRLHQEAYEAKIEASEWRQKVQRLADRAQDGRRTKDEWDIAEIAEMGLSRSSASLLEIQEKIMEREQQRINMSSPWWAYVPIARAPVSFYSILQDLFSTTFSFGSMLWAAIVVASLIGGVLGYWLRRQWGAVSMGSFCLLSGGHAIYEIFGTFPPKPLYLAIDLFVLVICLIPVIFLPWNNGLAPASNTLDKSDTGAASST